ncbi:hypothetical protein ACQPW1_48705 [Nocardia sp. CA-128927]|uniref:hypothetical protein n=1 Tax=Nocardia sp. CA-128927 TaxID=3239975 RepID=UPI003D9722E7
MGRNAAVARGRTVPSRPVSDQTGPALAYVRPVVQAVASRPEWDRIARAQGAASWSGWRRTDLAAVSWALAQADRARDAAGWPASRPTDRAAGLAAGRAESDGAAPVAAVAPDIAAAQGAVRVRDVAAAQAAAAVAPAACADPATAVAVPRAC